MDIPAAVTVDVLRWALKKFGAAFPASFPADGATEDKVQLWGELVAAHPWITGPVFVAGVYDIAWHHAGGFLPEPATALDFFQVAKGKVDREAQARLAVALPSPAYRDDQGTTPDERQRWALEDAEIRPWYGAILRRREEVAYLNERLDAQTLKWQRDIERIEDNRGTVPGMAPEARRARDRRTDAAKAGASGAASEAGMGQVVEIGKDVTGTWPR